MGSASEADRPGAFAYVMVVMKQLRTFASFAHSEVFKSHIVSGITVKPLEGLICVSIDH